MAHCRNCCSHPPIGGQVLDGHLTGLGSGQSDFRLAAGVRLLPQDVLVGHIPKVSRVPQDQLARVGAAGKNPVWGTRNQKFSK